MQLLLENATRTHGTMAGFYHILGLVPRQLLPLLRWRHPPEEFRQRPKPQLQTDTKTVVATRRNRPGPNARRAVPWFGRVLVQVVHQAALARCLGSVVAVLLL